MGSGKSAQDPIVLVIDFHHARGPEVELCFCKEGDDPVGKNDWSLLPFMALSDGAHTSTEDFSYFTLTQNPLTESEHTSSLFGISCSRQIDSASLINRPAEVTRSTVQKAVVVITDEPRHFGQLRERLSMVTSAWFAQRDFSDIDILKKFQESLAASLNNEEGEDKNLGLSLREMIHEFKYQTLVLFKCLLLQPKMLFFGSRCERLCMIQFSLISLIPGLINNLEDCADPSFDSYAKTVEKPTSLRTSERSSLLSYMGLPLQIFGKGSMFGPYTPLQQLDLLADYGTKSYVVGSTNSLLLQQKDRYSDILINLDEGTINISSPSLRNALSLSAADRRWIDFLTQTINETWDEAHPERPKAHGYVGSEEFIRLQFEEYLLALLSCVKYHDAVAPQNSGDAHVQQKSPGTQTLDIEGDPAFEFNPEFLDRWRTTSNYALFNRLTSDAMLFSIVEPRHPCAGGLSIEDVQRRLAQQVAELHLDERVKEGREVLNKHFATGQKKVTAAFNNFWADIEAMREAQRKRNEEKAHHAADESSSLGKENTTTSPISPRTSMSSTQSPAAGSWSIAGRKAPQVDLTQAQASVAAAGQRASAYFSSWGSWANDRRKEWQEKKNGSSTASSPRQSTATDGPERSHSRRGREPRHSLPHEEASNVNRSISRKKRWSSVFKRSDSSEPSRADAESPRELRHAESENESKSDESAVMVAHAREFSLEEQSMPRISMTDPPEEEEQEYQHKHEQRRPSAPTPTLVPSDRLRVSSPSENAAISPISPLRLDMTGESFFKDEKASPAPDNPASVEGSTAIDPSSQHPVVVSDTPSKPSTDAQK